MKMKEIGPASLASPGSANADFKTIYIICVYCSDLHREHVRGGDQ